MLHLDLPSKIHLTPEKTSWASACLVKDTCLSVWPSVWLCLPHQRALVLHVRVAVQRPAS